MYLLAKTRDTSLERFAMRDGSECQLYRCNLGLQGLGHIPLNALNTEWKWRGRVFGGEFVVAQVGAAYDAQASGASWKI
jgi:hypothetical protein